MLKDLEVKRDNYQTLRGKFPEQAARLDDWYNKELTYTSNAIEGNTLTRDETALVIEQGLTVGGKSLNDHNEAKDHFEAMMFIRAHASDEKPFDEEFVLNIHRIVTRTTLSDSGFYSKHRRRVTGSNFIFPNPLKVPNLMDEFGRELANASKLPQSAFEAHLRLVTIHPFSDGNGRTARLLMNAMLLRAGYCPLNVLPEQRKDYIDSVRLYQTEALIEPFYEFMAKRLDEALDDCISFLTPEI